MEGGWDGVDSEAKQLPPLPGPTRREENKDEIKQMK